MSQPELLIRTIGVLDAAGIEYMLTGSFASGMQGEPRSTHDIDLVVQLKSADIPALLAAFPDEEYYLSEPAIRDAMKHRQMFNVLDFASGTKVDFWMLKDEPFDQSRWSRRQRASFRGQPVIVTSPEDTILGKLRWAVMSGGSEKQFRDALRVYELQYPTLDLNYIHEWSAKLGTDQLWTQIQREAVIVDPSDE